MPRHAGDESMCYVGKIVVLPRGALGQIQEGLVTTYGVGWRGGWLFEEGSSIDPWTNSCSGEPPAHHAGSSGETKRGAGCIIETRKRVRSRQDPQTSDVLTVKTRTRVGFHNGEVGDHGNDMTALRMVENEKLGALVEEALPRAYQ